MPIFLWWILIRRITVSPESLRLSTDFTPFDGQRLKGWPTTTIIRGKIQLEDGELVGKAGGMYLNHR